MTPDYQPGDALIVTGDTGDYAHPFQPGQAVRFDAFATTGRSVFAWVADFTGRLGLVAWDDLAPAIDLTPEPEATCSDGPCLCASPAPLAPWERELLEVTKPSASPGPRGGYMADVTATRQSKPIRVGDWVRPKSDQPESADLGMVCRVRVLAVGPGVLRVSECDAGPIFHDASATGFWLVKPSDVYLVP